MRTEDRAIVLVSIGVSRFRGLVANALHYNADSQIQLFLMITAHRKPIERALQNYSAKDDCASRSRPQPTGRPDTMEALRYHSLSS